MDNDIEIVLSPEESGLFDVLEKVVAHFGLSTVMRVAGGWVRDKLMGFHSHDIDIALSDMTGTQFAELVNQYLQLHGQETHHIGVISSNPDQSKHLETATVRIMNMWIDFVNLRSETYTEHSRIPESIQIGTPEQDALRRDLTINALFYNLNIRKVEDFTGKGIQHLKSKTIATPLPPLQTFMDDPLRVLRSLRFASRLPGFVVDTELLQAASADCVIDALAKKIARERIGKEFDGVLLAARPELGIHWITTLGLFPVVFATPSQTNDIIDMKKASIDASNLVRQVVRALRSISLGWDDLTRRIAILASALLPFASYSYMTPKKKTDTVANYIVLESLKKTKSDAEQVDILHHGVKEFETIFKPSDPAATGIQFVSLENQRIKIGRLIRKLGELWHVSLLLACLDHLPSFETGISENQIDETLPADNPLFITYLRMKEHIEDLGFVGVWQMKPFFSGDDLKEMLGLAPGPLMGVALEKEIDWMLLHPNGDRDQCKEYVLSAEFREYLDTNAPPKHRKKNNNNNK